MTLEGRLRQLQRDGRLNVPFPGKGQTVARHQCLFDIGREDLSLARLAEAHIDALAILAEAGRRQHPNALYGVWAAETSEPLRLDGKAAGLELNGSKTFCSGAPSLLIVRVGVRALSQKPRRPRLALPRWW